MDEIKKRMQKVSYVFAHFALFIVFFWFGFLKLLGLSPANELVEALLVVTMPWWPFSSFIVVLGLVEMIIGLLFVFRKTEKLAMIILIPHMITTFIPLIMLPALTWQMAMVPTLAGQYIIKNIVIVALASSIIVGYRKR